MQSRDASAHSIGLVSEASVWSILLLGNGFDNKGFDRVLKGVTFHVGHALSRLTRNVSHIQPGTVLEGEPDRKAGYKAGVPQAFDICDTHFPT